MKRAFNILICVVSAIILIGCEELPAEHTALPTSPASTPLRAHATLQEKPSTKEPTGEMTLREALSLALTRSPQLKAFSWEARVAEAMQLQAGLRPNPELGVEVEEVGGSGPRSRFDAAEASISLSQLIELGDKRHKRMALARAQSQLAGWDYEAARLDVLAGVSRVFVEVLAAQRKLQLAEELLDVSGRMADAVARRVDAGKDSPVARSRAEIAHSQMQITHEKAKQNLYLAKVRLVSFWDGAEPQFTAAVGDLDSVGDIPTLADLFALLDNNPDLARWAAEIESRQKALAYERAKSVQDVTVGAGMQHFGEGDDNAVMFGLSIPIGVSDRNQGGKQAAAHNLAKAGQLSRAAYIRVRQQLAKAYQNLSNAHIEATTLKQDMLPSAESVFEASQEGYEEGKLDYLNLLDGQRTLFEVRSQHIEALVAFQHAKVDVERLIGRKLESIE